MHKNKAGQDQVTAYFVDHQWAHNGLQTPIHSAVHCALALGPGRYLVEWWDASMGQCIASEHLAVSTAATQSLRMPDFRRHIALKVRWLEPVAASPDLGVLRN